MLCWHYHLGDSNFSCARSHSTSIAGTAYDNPLGIFCCQPDGMWNDATLGDTLSALAQLLHLATTGQSIAGDAADKRQAWHEQVCFSGRVATGWADEVHAQQRHDVYTLASNNCRSRVASGCRTNDVVNCNSLLSPQVRTGTTPACTLVPDSPFQDLIQLHVRPGAGGSPAVWLQHASVHRYSSTFAGKLLATVGGVIATYWTQPAATTAKMDLVKALDRLGSRHMPAAATTKVRSSSKALAVRVFAGCMVSQLVATACTA